MWMTIKDKEIEYVINFSNVICFGKIQDCKKEPGIELATIQGGINLVYETEENRDEIYEKIIDWVQSIRIEI